MQDTGHHQSEEPDRHDDPKTSRAAEVDDEPFRSRMHTARDLGPSGDHESGFVTCLAHRVRRAAASSRAAAALQDCRQRLRGGRKSVGGIGIETGSSVRNTEMIRRDSLSVRATIGRVFSSVVDAIGVAVE